MTSGHLSACDRVRDLRAATPESSEGRADRRGRGAAPNPLGLDEQGADALKNGLLRPGDRNVTSTLRPISIDGMRRQTPDTPR